MKRILFTLLGLVTLGAIAYMVYDARNNDFVLTNDPVADDQRLYEWMRKDMQAWLKKIGKDYGAWFDDLVSENYASGAYTINGIPSKAASYAAVASIHYDGGKKRYYNQLVTNLKNRYQ